jgi:hypothetical protein
MLKSPATTSPAPHTPARIGAHRDPLPVGMSRRRPRAKHSKPTPVTRKLAIWIQPRSLRLSSLTNRSCHT